VEAQLGVTFSPCYYRESKLSDDKDDYHVDKVEKEEEEELVELVNQLIRPFIPKFEDTDG